MPGSLIAIRDRAAYVWGIRAVRTAGLVAIALSTAGVAPHPGAHGEGLVVTVGLVVASAGWAGWLLTEGRPRWMAGCLLLTAVAGGMLAAVTPSSSAVAFSAIAALGAGSSLRLEVSVGITVAGVVALAVTSLLTDGSTGTLLGYSVLICGGLAAGLVRQANSQRAEQAERLLEQTTRAREAEARAAALAERARIAREIHDILAHSLGALTVQIEAANALLGAASLPADDPSLVKAVGCVNRAGQLAREGLTETRRALHALRGDLTSLPELLSVLVTAHSADSGVGTVPLHVTGAERTLPPDASLAVFRTAQETLTNAAKHAPGSVPAVTLAYRADEVALTVTNALTVTHAPAGSGGATRAASAGGSGYGLIGLRERAELAGGTLTARAVDGTWQVCVTIPT
ncbi:histidine kinase [Streptomyces sp. NBC_01476]|uniref:sensor histidine kinase n=1 Tax=Streptomyces sp. NBC_01476 TaxID=2903881 RepID=UPI002E344FA2|nr:histidine kinase [Streptomyces sp. NBC_01476]